MKNNEIKADLYTKFLRCTNAVLAAAFVIFALYMMAHIP